MAPLKKNFYFERVRARVLPKQIRNAYALSPDTVLWLKACALNTLINNDTDETITYTIPLLGITNRPLPGYRKAGFNLFKTLVKVIANDEMKNLDQCTIEFGSRLPINKQDFNDELYRQISLSRSRIKTRGQVVFYSHAPASVAVATDLETLRLSILKAMPVINLDWLDPSSDWEVLWNPCAHLEPVKLQLEEKLIKFLDQLVQQICASQCNAVIQRANCFFDNAYLPHRKKHQLPPFNKIIFTPNANIQSNDILERFNPESNLVTYIDKRIQSAKHKKYIASKTRDNEGWLPAII